MADKLVFESPRVTLRIGGQPAPSAAPRSARDPFPVIVGCPRSGTSLLAVMLDAAFAAGDSAGDLVPAQRAWRLAGDPASLRRRFFDIVTADRMTISNWSDFGLDKDLFWRRLHAIPAFTVAAGTRAFYALYGESQRKARTGDKTPGYVFTMQHIQALLPEAHFIHVIRDPRDTAMSWRKTWFAPSQDYAVLGAFWRQNVEVGRRAAPSLRHYQEIRFEDLVLRPEARAPAAMFVPVAGLRAGDARFRRARAGAARQAAGPCARRRTDDRARRAHAHPSSISRGRRWPRASRRGGAK